MRKSTVFVSLAFAAALAGCGNSGGGSSAPYGFASTAASTSATNARPTGTASTRSGSTTVRPGSTVATGATGTGATGTTGSGRTGTTTGTGTPPVVVSVPPKPALNGVGAGAAVGDGPAVTVSEPARGGQVATGPVLVKGKATHPDGVAVVTVGGATVLPAADGSFSYVVNVNEGHSVIEVVATSVSGKSTDASIGVLAGTFQDDPLLVKDAAAARVSNEALAAVGPIVGAELEKNLAALAGTQVLNNSVSVLGRNVTTTVTVAQVSVGGTNIDVHGTANGLDADIAATNLQVDVTVDVNAGSVFGIPLHLNLPLDFHFDRFAAMGLITASVQNGAVAVDASGLKVDYSPTIVGSLIGQGALNAINSALGAISSVIGVNLRFDEVAIANKLIDLAWNGGLRKTTDAKLADMITAAGNKGLPVTIASYNATITYLPSSISIDQDGVSLTSDLDVTLAAPDVHASLGSIVYQGAAPTLTGATGVKLAINENTINRALEVAWRKGALDKTLDVNIVKTLNMGFNAASLSLLVPVFSSIIPAGAELQFAIAPLQAPVLSFAPNAQANLAITELDLEVGFVDGNGNYTKLLTLAVNCDVPTGFNVLGTGQARSLELSPGTPRFTFDIRYSIIAGVPKQGIENALSFILPPVVQFAGTHFLPTIPLPQANLAGLQPTVDTLATDGAKGTFLRADISVK